MKKRIGLLKFSKKALAVTLAIGVSMSTLPMNMVEKPISVQAATTASNVLSDEDRGVLFANSRSDFRDESIYFAMVTRFYNGDESNDVQCWDGKALNLDDPAWRGDFKGLIEKLDYIKALGFTAVWITPVVENISGYDYHGYHASDFSKVDPRYESDDCTYQDLIDACHSKGMKIIQDVVFNHTGNFGEANLCPMFDKVGDLSSADCLQVKENSALPSNYAELKPEAQYAARLALMKNTDGVNHDVNNIYHHYGNFNWDDWTCQVAQIAGDCVDLNTENPLVYNYLIDCYTKYINMGVDGFRVDTVRHISRLTFNKVFNDAFKEAAHKAGNDNFYMFGEVCTRDNGNYWYRQSPSMSTPFYTWKDTKDYAWSDTDWEVNYESAVQNTKDNCDNISEQPTSTNALLDGNNYHTPDYSQFSGLNVIDFPMHWSFKSAENAFSVAKRGDQYYNDATWNVTYVDSHDYAPDGAPEDQRFSLDQSTWAENLSLMFTFRGIPCIYYGSETEFQKGELIDKGPTIALKDSGRAYYGDNIEGTITAGVFGQYGNVSGAVADTLKHPLSQHIQRLNRIRQSVPALRKGQYSTEGVNGNLAFKRRYTDENTDSFVCVSISGDATFTGVPNGKYVDAVTGDVKNVTNGTLAISVSGKGNMKVYVLDTAKTPAPGRVVTNGLYLTDGGAIQDIEPVDIKIVKETSLTLDKSEVTVLEGNTEKVTATVAPADATYKTVSWTTSDAKVATVSGGKITGVSVGTATITAKTVNGLTKTVKVTVNENPNIVKPTGIQLDKTKVSIIEGQSENITATVLPENADNKKVTWTVADKSVATVDSYGKIKAVSAGTTTVTATTFNGYSATVTVEVKEKSISNIGHGVYFQKPDDWGSSINVYIWDKALNKYTGAWPGVAMVDLGDGLFGYKCSISADAQVIFNDGSNKTDDLEFVQDGYYESSGYKKTLKIEETTSSSETTSQQETTKPVETTSQKETTKPVETTSQKETTKPAETTKQEETTKPTDPVTPSFSVTASASSASAIVGNKVTITASAKNTTGACSYSYLIYNKTTNTWARLANKISANKFVWTAGSAGERAFFAEVTDSTGKTVRSEAVNVSVKSSSESWSVVGKASNATPAKGAKVTLSATVNAIGTRTYKYSYIVYNKSTNEWARVADKIDSSSFEWTVPSGGDRVFYIDVTNANGKTVRSNEIYISTKVDYKPISVGATASSANVMLNKTTTITANATGGSGNLKYSFIIFNKLTGEWYRLADRISSNKFTWTAPSAGNRVIYVDVTDEDGQTVRAAGVNISVNPIG